MEQRDSLTFVRFLPIGLGLAALVVAGCGPTYPDCDNDEQCHEGEYCVNGQCQQCRDNRDCGEGQQCNQGRCEDVPGYCGSASDCGEGQDCENNRCVTPMSTEDLGPVESTEAPCQLQPVYFAFDQAELDSAARDALQANARCIRERSIESVHVTGHTDDQGTEEYNLALGDRRARGTKRYLTSLGVSQSSITISSAGEEFATGTDDAGRRRDRRAEISER